MLLDLNTTTNPANPASLVSAVRNAKSIGAKDSNDQAEFCSLQKPMRRSMNAPGERFPAD